MQFLIHSLNTELQGNHKREVKGLEVSCLHHCSNEQLLLMYIQTVNISKVVNTLPHYIISMSQLCYNLITISMI